MSFLQSVSAIRVLCRAAVPPLVVLTAIACTNESGTQTAQNDSAAASTVPATVTQPAAPSGPIDEQLAEQGKHLFETKGCAGCHRIGGGRLTGPDLKGVTERQTYAWIVAMITHPDSMLKVDPTARQLLLQYGTQMANLNVSADEARALYEYLRHESQ